MKNQITIFELSSGKIIGFENKYIDNFIQVGNLYKKIPFNNNVLNFGYLNIRKKIYQLLNLEYYLEEKSCFEEYKTLILLKKEFFAFPVKKILSIKFLTENDKLEDTSLNNKISYLTKYDNKLIPIINLDHFFS